MNDLNPMSSFAESLTPKRAVTYLRVSTSEQANKGGQSEGFPIPAQRDANKKKAQSLSAVVAKEFAERGVSGTSTNRPALKAMLRYLEEEQGMSITSSSTRSTAWPATERMTSRSMPSSMSSVSGWFPPARTSTRLPVDS